MSRRRRARFLIGLLEAGGFLRSCLGEFRDAPAPCTAVYRSILEPVELLFLSPLALPFFLFILDINRFLSPYKTAPLQYYLL